MKKTLADIDDVLAAQRATPLEESKSASKPPANNQFDKTRQKMDI